MAIIVPPTTPTQLPNWADWLARTGYGVDYCNDADPPCTLADLAAAYHRMEPGTSVEDWAWCITENTGAFGGDR
jgi:hypothetical protein